jgi:hypothetical protein
VGSVVDLAGKVRIALANIKRFRQIFDKKPRGLLEDICINGGHEIGIFFVVFRLTFISFGCRPVIVQVTGSVKINLCAANGESR